MDKYRPTKCEFRRTIYNKKVLYTLCTVLVNVQDRSKEIPTIVSLGEKLDFVKRLATKMDCNNTINAFLYVRKVEYMPCAPFYIRKGDYVESDDKNQPILHYSHTITCLLHDNGDEYVYLKHNDPKSKFNYRVNRGDAIFAEKMKGEWCVPSIIPHQEKYPTEIIPLEELLK